MSCSYKHDKDTLKSHILILADNRNKSYMYDMLIES